jgi:hypothetical protein
MNPAFDIGRQVGNNFGAVRQQAKDENVIESILGQAMQSGDPTVLQSSIGKILSQVSPERQGTAIQYLQNTYNTLQQKQEKQRLEQEGKTAAQQAGYTYGAPPQVAAQQVKDKAKSGRLAQYGLDGNPSANPSNSNLPTAQGGTPATLQGTSNPQQPQVPQSPFRKLTDDQLIVAMGAPDREVSEPAKAEADRRATEKEFQNKKDLAVFNKDLDASSEIRKDTQKVAEQLPVKRTALNLMVDAIANKNLGMFSRDNLAEMTGIEGFRSQEGAVFKTAGKEYFLGSISRAGARPNQWIEQQIQDMMTKVGRSTEANLTVARAMGNELDLDEERVRAEEEIANRLRGEGDQALGKLGTQLNKHMTKYAEQKQHELFNDMRAIKAIADKEPQRYQKVESGTPVSNYVAQALLLQFNNDPKAAAAEAKKLGYKF